MDPWQADAVMVGKGHAPVVAILVPAVKKPAAPLRSYFAAKGTSAPVVLDQADKKPLLVVVGTWVDEVGEEPAVALGGLLSLRNALRADLADPPPD